MKSTVKYEKKIEELRIQCQLKTDECYEAWMSLTAANEDLERVTVDLDNRSFEKLCLDQAIVKQAAEFRDLSSQYERDKRLWGIAIDELGRKIKTMKEEQCQLSCEAHECVDSIPELNKMVYAVQALVAQCDDLKLKFNEEQEKRKKLYNQVQEAKVVEVETEAKHLLLARHKIKVSTELSCIETLAKAEEILLRHDLFIK